VFGINGLNTSNSFPTPNFTFTLVRMATRRLSETGMGMASMVSDFSEAEIRLSFSATAFRARLISSRSFSEVSVQSPLQAIGTVTGLRRDWDGKPSLP
jgi:hypothetical protein